MPPETSELDKLKRRMIRSVARLMREKATEQEVWDELRKEYGDSCKNLWMRMRSLTLKKLKRLQDAEDRVDNVPVVARMSLTDWLLYDMVIVHEKMDPKDEEKLLSSNLMPKLFSLVQMFRIEGLTGSQLAEAWTNATLYYNSSGYQCSPMMMQRRWYLLTEATREKFYQFWFAYRGNVRLLAQASQSSPSKIQQDVALRYPNIITRPFPDWRERIEKRLIILPEEFQDKIREMQGKPTSSKDESVPDLIIMEPKIDTIVLADSDSESGGETKENVVRTENKEDEANSEEASATVKIKSEPQDDCMEIYKTRSEKDTDFQNEIEQLLCQEDEILLEDEVKSVETAKEDVEPSRTKFAEQAIDVYENNTIIENTDQKTIIQGNFNDDSQDSILIEDDDETNAIEDVVSNVSDVNINDGEMDGNGSSSLKEANDRIDFDIGIKSNNSPIVHNDIENDATLNETVTNSNELEMMPVISAIACGDEAKIKIEPNTREHVTKTPEERSSDDEGDIIMLKEEETFSPEGITTEAQQELNNIVKEPPVVDLEEGIEFADDGIEYFEEDEENCSNEEPLKEDMREVVAENPDAGPKFDLKLLMNPVVYTRKIDDMDVYKDRSLFVTIDDKELLDKITFESKPVSSKSINVETATTNIKTEPIDDNQNDVQADDLFLDSSDSEPEKLIGDSMRVKMSSYLFQKPRNRSYNPIQLCKNPDFNTRLKRLNVGFFGSFRNRAFLKVCKPMTIDVSKAFETKVINGTVYLKENNESAKITSQTNSHEPFSTSSILPSAVAVNSLMPQSNQDVDQILQEELKKRILERNKTINLPSISVVRQINEQLQKAEVAPIMAINRTQNTGKEEYNNVNNISKNLQINSEVRKTNKPNWYKPTASLTKNKNTSNNSYNSNQQQKNPTKITNEYNPILPMMTDKTKVNNNSNAKANCTGPGFTNNFIFTDETLLTIDTLHKMLSALDPNCMKNKVFEHNSKAANISHKESKKDQKPKVPVTTTVSQKLKSSHTDNPSKEVKQKNLEQTQTKVRRRQRGKRCCWASYKIDNMKCKIKAHQKHNCPPLNCECCCLNKLRFLQNEMISKTINKCHDRVESCSDTDKLPSIIPPTPVPKIHININILSDPKEKNIARHAKCSKIAKTPKISIPNEINPIGVSPEHKAADSSLIINKVPKEKNAHSYHYSSRRNPSRLNKRMQIDSKLPGSKKMPCTCLSHVVVDQKNTLLIDGAQECEFHGRTYVYKRKNKPLDTKVSINLNKIMAEERPYYLGKNKILLTDVTQPDIPEPIHAQLSNDVQVILLPSGLVTYSQTPGTKLTPTQLAAMPMILNSVKDQINAAGILLPETCDTPPVIDIINLDEASPFTSAQHVEANNCKENESNGKNDSDINKVPDDVNVSEDLTAEINNTENNGTLKTKDDVNSNQETQLNSEINYKSGTVLDKNVIQSGNDDKQNVVTAAQDSAKIKEETSEIIQNKSYNNDFGGQQMSETLSENLEVKCVNDKTIENELTGNLESQPNQMNSRNLLSDLMEMSGILEEDIAPAPDEPASNMTETEPQALNTQPPLLLDIASGAPIFDQLPAPIGKTETSKNVLQNTEATQELNPVTSFKDLKYACENGGNFFKLDLDTGLIVPINVCIKKSKRSSLVNEQQNLTTDVIDLTDEQGSSSNTARDSTSESTCLDSIIKPQVIIKLPVSASPHSTITSRDPQRNTPHIRILSKTKGVTRNKTPDLNALYNNLKPLKLPLTQLSSDFLSRTHSRKQSLRDLRLPLKLARNLDKIDTKINLEDSDEPMEEEYLVPSSDESSDDEPLANVAKRMRYEEMHNESPQQPHSNQSILQIEQIDENVVGNELTQTKETQEMVVDDKIDDELAPHDPKIPKPTHLVVTNSDQPIILNYSQDSKKKINDEINSEGSQDDCILGV